MLSAAAETVDPMHIDAQWHSRQGTKTPDNRDHAGIATRPGEFLGIVADGSTTGQSNGEYACAIIRALVDWFAGTTVGVTPDGLVERLRIIQQGLIADFPRGSASYVILHAAERQPVLVLHAGDTLFGKVADRSEIQWRTEPHTLANALAKVPLPELAKLPARHRLIRSLRSRGFIAPEVTNVDLTADTLLAATDGFWAELSQADQMSYLDGHRCESMRGYDDCSVLCMNITETTYPETTFSAEAAANFYVRSAS